MANTDNKKKSGVSKSNTTEIILPKRSTQASSARSTTASQQTKRTSSAQTNTRSTTQTRRKASTPPPKRKKKKSGDSGAKVFLFVMLLGVAIFVAIVCMNGTESKLFSDSTTKATAQTTVEENTYINQNNNVPVQGTVPQTEPETEAPEDKPSFYNPATVTDCNFATVVVNRNYRIPESYEDTLDLVYVCGSGQRLQREVAVHYEAMFNAAAEEGIYLTPVSGYRSYETQVELYNNKINQKLNEGYSAEEAPIEAATVVMVPGSSEHNLGYAMDIVSLYEDFEETDEFAWLMENAEDYGFILRYPKDKQDITMVIYEPWHWRYVGVEAAKKINASGLTLEEYYGKSAQ